MKSLNKPLFNVGDILVDCARTCREPKCKKILEAQEAICNASDVYEHLAEHTSLFRIQPYIPANNLTKKDMCELYDQKFVAHKTVREKYYDKIMALTEKCPICGIGQVSTLDHYLAKTLYPIFAVTPLNLVPVCADCNKNKLDFDVTDYITSPLHPYFDYVDDCIWLKAEIKRCDDGFVAIYKIDEGIKLNNRAFYARLNKHFEVYQLGRAYSVQANSEISDNIHLWRDIARMSGEKALASRLLECLESFCRVQKNTWKTALYRAIISDCAIILS